MALRENIGVKKKKELDVILHHISVFRRDINYFGVNVCIIEPGFFKTAVTSLDPLERELHRLWNQLSPEVQASYGDKYLDKCKQTANVYVNSQCM